MLEALQIGAASVVFAGCVEATCRFPHARALVDQRRRNSVRATPDTSSAWRTRFVVVGEADEEELHHLYDRRQTEARSTRSCAMISRHRRVLVVGCNTCAAVALAGGEKEVETLGRAAQAGDLAQGLDRRVQRSASSSGSASRSSSTSSQLEGCDAILSLGCGAGVALLAGAQRRAGVPRHRHALHRLRDGTGALAGRVLGVRLVRARRDRWHLPDHALRQGHHERPVRRRGRRHVRARRPAVRLGGDLRPPRAARQRRRLRQPRSIPRTTRPRPDVRVGHGHGG